MMSINVRLGESLLAWQVSGPLPEEDGEGDVVKDDTNIEGTDKHVNSTGNLVETSSLLELDLRAFQISHWWVVHDCLESVALKGFEVHLTDLNDDLESHEVNDAMLYGMLVGQQVDINNSQKIELKTWLRPRNHPI